jgi:predicted Zn-dependent protease
MSGTRRPAGQGLGLAPLGRLSPGAQRDVCARCHLQGDARIDLVNGAPDRTRPLAAQIPVLVPALEQTDFRFVGQLESLVLSACFRSSPAMTCTTCHDPHTGTRAQGVESFDRACIACHKPSPTHTSLTTRQVTGEPARGAAGCVDCHVRRSQPFDLPHVRAADHFIRRRIERPQHDVAHRQFAAREGALVLYDDGRLQAALGTAAGRRWAGGVTAMGLLTMGRFADAARLLAAFPSPGSEAARVPSAPEGFAPLETSAAFHTVRGYVLIGGARLDEARRAFSDAIALDPNAAEARMARARLSLDAGDVRGAGIDTEAVIRAFPQAEQPWDLRIEIAQRTGRPDLALSAADASTRLWPSNPRTWAIVATLAAERGQADRARQALERARALSPSVVSGLSTIPASQP